MRKEKEEIENTYIPENRDVEMHIFVKFGTIIFRTDIQTAKDAEEKFYKIRPLESPSKEFEYDSLVDKIIKENIKKEELTPFSQCLKNIDGVLSGRVYAYGFEIHFVPTFHISDIIFDVINIFCEIFQVTVSFPFFNFLIPEEGITDFDLQIFLNDIKETCEDFSLSSDFFEKGLENFVNEKERNIIVKKERVKNKKASHKSNYKQLKKEYETALASLVEYVCTHSQNMNKNEEISIPIKEIQKIVEYGMNMTNKKEIILTKPKSIKKSPPK